MLPRDGELGQAACSPPEGAFFSLGFRHTSQKWRQLGSRRPHLTPGYLGPAGEQVCTRVWERILNRLCFFRAVLGSQPNWDGTEISPLPFPQHTHVSPLSTAPIRGYTCHNCRIYVTRHSTITHGPELTLDVTLGHHTSCGSGRCWNTVWTWTRCQALLQSVLTALKISPSNSLAPHKPQQTPISLLCMSRHLISRMRWSWNQAACGLFRSD